MKKQQVNQYELLQNVKFLFKNTIKNGVIVGIKILSNDTLLYEVKDNNQNYHKFNADGFELTKADLLEKLNKEAE